MDISAFEKLYNEGLVSKESLAKSKSLEAEKLFSLHWELKTILYLRVLLLSGGFGILVYKNIDSIGHQAVLLFIALVCAGCFIYCVARKLPFSNKKVLSPNAFFDYILLLACLTFITFVGYLQFAYNVFGFHFGLATFIPMIVLFVSAYYFDHIAVLGMGITALGSWAGISVTPLSLLKSNNFNSQAIMLTAFILGVLLLTAAWFSTTRRIKAHFSFTYSNFGTHLLFVSTLAAMFYYSDGFYVLVFLLLILLCIFFYRKALKEKSFYYLLVLSVYGYIGLSFVVIQLVFSIRSLDIGGFYLAFLYFIASAIGVIVFLVRNNTKLKSL